MKHSLSLVFLAALAAFSVHAQRIPLINSGEVLSRATVLQDSQKYEGAIKELLTIPKRDTNYVTSLSRLAELYFLNKQMELSEATADAVLKHPSEFGAMMWRVKGSIYELKKEYDKGIGIVEAALKKYPFDVELLYLRGLLYHNKHDYKNAVRAYYDVLAVAPRSIGTHLNLGNLALWLGDRTHAMMSYGIYVTLRNQDNEKLQSLEKFVSNQVEWEGKGAAEKIDNNAYERLDQIMRANVAMDKKFKTEVLINIAAVKQYEMFFQQLNTASTSVDDPWTKFYGPIYSAIRDQKMVAPFLYHMLESSSLDEVTKWRSKHQRDLDKYYNMINPILIRSREMVVVPQSYNIPSPTHAEYDKNIIEGVGAMIGEQRTGRWIWLHRNGELSAEGNYSNGKKSGEWKYYSNSGFLLSSESPDTGETTEFYNDGSKQVHYFMKNDKVDGDIVFYYPCGSMSEKRTHKDGKRTGKSQMWYENGVLKSEFEYADDELTNTWTDYDERGKVTAKVAYKNGQRDGLFERFHPNGKLKDRYMYSAGKANGIAEAYHNNGVLKFKGQYTEETPVGLWIYQNRKGEKYEQRTYDSKGDLDKESILYSHGNIYEKYTYKNGSLIEIVWFDENGKESKKFGSPDGNFEGKHNFENGQVSSEGTYKNGKRDGKWTTYYLGGLVAATYNYVDGDFEGEQTDFYRSGKKYSVNEYKKGERDGYQQWFHENGQLSRHGWELKGNNQQQWLSYYADGTIEQDNYYRDGEPADTVYGFAVDGKLWARDFYENGEKTSETSFDGLQQILFNDAKTDGERTFPINQELFTRSMM
ncbi:MAG: tetratricopeptide repeat protein [Bacteroidota bacterium]